MIKLIEKLEKSFDFWFLLLSGATFFILRIPSLIEPYWYGDEGIYHVLGFGIRHGRLLYRDVWDNKPPLLYLIYAFFNSDQFLIRFFSAVVGVLSLIVFFFLCKNLFKTNYKKKYAAIPTIIFGLLFATPFIEGNIANAENFMLLSTLLASLIILKVLSTKGARKINLLAFLAGLLLGISFLIKIVALFDFAFLSALIIFAKTGDVLTLKISNLKKEILKVSGTIILTWLGFFLPIFFTFFAFFVKGALTDFITASFSQNIGYVGYSNNLIIPQGLLIVKLIILFFFSILIYIKRKQMSTSSIFILLWLSFSLFSAFFSQRPYTHYLLVLLPSFSLFIGLLLWDKKMRKAASVIFLVTIFLSSTHFTYYGKTLSYYRNYLSFIAEKESIFSYRSFFDKQTPGDYEISSYINRFSASSDSIFVWGNNAQVYILSKKLPPGRYTVAYHMLSVKAHDETEKALEKTKPKFIIIMQNVPDYPFSLSGYREKVRIGDAVIYEKII